MNANLKIYSIVLYFKLFKCIFVCIMCMCVYYSACAVVRGQLVKSLFAFCLYLSCKD